MRSSIVTDSCQRGWSWDFGGKKKKKEGGLSRNDSE